MNSLLPQLDPPQLLTCRVCLATDVRLYDIHKCFLADAFGDITGTPLLQTDRLHHLCPLCCAQLAKCAAFRAQSHRACTLLQDAMAHMKTATIECISKIDRRELIPPLSKTNTVIIDFGPEKIHDTESVVFSLSHSNLKTEIDPISPVDSPINEECDDVFLQDTGNNDDIYQNITEFKCETENTEHYIDSVTKKTKPKGKMYNKKTEEDFVNFSKQYNVEVIFLSKEQQIKEVEERKDSAVYRNARFQCKECFTGYMTERAYKKHVKCHDESTGSHVCDTCSTRFPSRPRLLRHHRYHRVRFICNACSKISKDSTTAKRHHKWHEGYKYECSDCGKFFNKPSSFRNHVRENHAPAACDVCDERAEGTKGLAEHKAAAHSQGFKCSTCSVTFRSETALNKHYTTSGDDCSSARPCTLCGDTFALDALLKSHVESQHKETVFRCKECAQTFLTDRKLGVHWSRTHQAGGTPTPRRDYMCEVCARSYMSESMLRSHQRVHTGEKPHACPTCHKRFRLPASLRVHMNTHTGERPYKCPLCPETFKSYSQKHKHRLLAHTLERRHKCHMCEKSYVVSFDLKMHIHTVHMRAPGPQRARRRGKT